MVLFSRALAALAVGSASSVAAASGFLRSQAIDDTKSRKLEDGVKFEETCTALIGIGVDTRTDPVERNQTWMSCVTPNGMIHDLPEVCKEWVEDVSTKGHFKSNHTRMNVEGATLHPTDLLYLPHFPPEFTNEGVIPSDIMFRSIGDRSLLAVRVITTDGIPTTTEEQLRNELFFFEDSVTHQMSGCSQDKLRLYPKNIKALIGGPTIEETLTMTHDDCMKFGAGEVNITDTLPGSVEDYVECPANSFICVGLLGNTVYNNDFAMPNELPDAGGTATIKCQIEDETGSTQEITVKMRTYVYKKFFDLEMIHEDYMISQVEVGVGENSEKETIYSYPYTENGVEYVGGTVKTGVLKTAKDLFNEHREVTLLKVCVIRSEEVCKNISPTTPRNAYEFNNKITSVDGEAPYGFDNGVITVKIPHPNSAHENVIRNAVTKKLLTIFGVGHPEELSDFMMYCVPEGSMTREMYSFVDSWLSVYSDKYCAKIAAHMRGLGHNFGLGPARVYKTWENDLTGVLGDTTFTQSKRCYNGAKLAQTGWFDPEEHTFHKFSPPVTFDLHGFTMMPEVQGRMKIITFNRANPIDMYIFFNWAEDGGPNAEADEDFKNKVIIDQMGRYGVQFDISYRFAVLGEGETYVRKGYYEELCDISITVNTIDVTTGIASVSYTGCIPNQPTESPTPAPTAPTDAPTPPPTFIPAPECYALNDICEAENDCCNEGNGACLRFSTPEGFNSRVVCAPAGTSPNFDSGKPIPFGPTDIPGKCNDDGKCNTDENCFSCPSDCNGMLSGPKENRYCCDGFAVRGSGVTPFALSTRDDRCNC